MTRSMFSQIGRPLNGHAGDQSGHVHIIDVGARALRQGAKYMATYAIQAARFIATAVELPLKTAVPKPNDVRYLLPGFPGGLRDAR